MHRAHKIRLYPTREQKVLLLKTAGTSRYVYNWGLAEWKAMWKAVEDGTSTQKPSAFVLMKRWTQERPEWSYETFRGAQDRALHDLGTAFQKLWRGQTKDPTFHKKGKKKDSFYVDNAHAYIDGSHIMLPRIGKVRLAENLRFEGKIMGYTVSTYAGQWHVSVEVDLSDAKRPCFNPTSVVGIDVGLKHIATASDGTVLDAPASLKRLDVKLRNAQRALARSQRNSKNHQKLLLKKQKVQNRINNIRSDVTHKFTSTITKNHGVVVVEDLNIEEMKEKAPSKAVRRAFNSSLMTSIHYQLSYKARKLVKVSQCFPSSKTCSHCGAIKSDLKLSERTYVCPHCGLTIDRDLNAAINLCKAGMVNPGVPVE